MTGFESRNSSSFNSHPDSDNRGYKATILRMLSGHKSHTESKTETHRKSFRDRLRKLGNNFRKDSDNDQPNPDEGTSSTSKIVPPTLRSKRRVETTTNKQYENITIYGGNSHFGDQYITMQQCDEEAERNRQTSQFVASLKYPEMFARLNEIKQAPYDTFQWILTGETGRGHDFRTWLESDHRTFVVLGKAGSGKSTFMKFVYESLLKSQRSIEASGDRATILFHSFYRAGTLLQRSMKGLLASLLYQIILANPYLLHVTNTAKRLFVQSYLDDWSIMQLRELLYLMVKESPGVLLLFLDGLDEFSADEELKDLFRLIDDIQAWGQCKICISSRPLSHILNYLSSSPSLNLHEQTADDIKRVVYQELSSMTRRYTHEEKSKLTLAICDRADGVFIWVYYVLKNVSNGIEINDDLQTLLDRINLLPSRIEELYSEMWTKQNSDHGVHRDESRQIFNFGRHFPMPLLQLALALHRDTLYEILRKGKPVEFVTIQRICESTRQRVANRSAGLIECVAKDDQDQSQGDLTWTHISYRKWSNTAVQFLHRSVQTFLEETSGGLSIIGQRNADDDRIIDRLVLESNLGLHIQDEEFPSYPSCIDFAFSTAWLTQDDSHIVDKTREIYRDLLVFDKDNRVRCFVGEMFIRHYDPMFYDLDGLWATYAPIRTTHLLQNYGSRWSPYYKGYLAMCAVLHNVTWWDTLHTNNNTIEILKLLKLSNADLAGTHLYIQGNDKLCIRSPAGRLLLKPCVYFLSQPSPAQVDLSFIQDVVTVLDGVDLKGQYLTIFFSQYYATPGLIASVSMYQFTTTNISIGMVFAAADLYNALAEACKDHRSLLASQVER